MIRWICGLELRDALRREALGDQLAQPGLPGRVHREERHRLVGVRRPRARVERDAHLVGVDAVGAHRPVEVGVAREDPEVVLARCGRAAPRPAAARRPGRGRPGARSRRGRRRGVAGRSRGGSCVSLHDHRDDVVEAVGELGVGEQSHPGLQQRPEERQQQGLEHPLVDGLVAGSEGCAEAVGDQRPDPDAQALDVWVVAQQALGRGGGQVRGARDRDREVPGRLLQACGRGAGQTSRRVPLRGDGRRARRRGGRARRSSCTPSRARRRPKLRPSGPSPRRGPVTRARRGRRPGDAVPSGPGGRRVGAGRHR